MVLPTNNLYNCVLLTLSVVYFNYHMLNIVPHCIVPPLFKITALVQS